MFVGRDPEVEALSERLAERRLVTLIGPAGVGKTTLARVVAEHVAPTYDLGARSVDLTEITGRENVHRVIAGQLGYRDFASLIESPVDKSVLLLIDNCEHVVDAAADAIDILLCECMAPTVIATSRRPLGLDLETVISLGPLPVPLAGHATTDNPAIEVFVGRALDVGVEITSDLETVGEICRRLDGIPLAIELAATRTRSMSLVEILEGLDAQLELLRLPRHRGSSRHKSLRAAIESSFRLLEPTEADFLVGLSVISGPFDLDAAHKVAGEPGSTPIETRDLIDQLVECSLLTVDTTGRIARYRLLESIRAFAGEQLASRGDVDAVTDRLVDHVVEKMLEMMAMSQQSWGANAVADLLDVYSLARTAIPWAIEHDESPDRPQLMAAVLWGLIHQAHSSEIVSLVQRVLARWPGSVGAFGADAVATLATGTFLLGEPHRAIELIEEAIDSADRSLFAPVTLRRVRGQAAEAVGDTEAAVGWFLEGATIARQNGLPAWAVELDIDRAAIQASTGRDPEMLALVRSAIAESVELGSTLTTVWGRVVEACLLANTDPESALRIVEPVIAESYEVDYPAGVHAGLRAQSVAHRMRGDLEAAARSALELVDALMLNGAHELHMVIGPAIEILRDAGRTEHLDDLIVSWNELPIMSMIATSDRPPPPPADRRSIGRAETVRVLRVELGSVVDGTGTESAAPLVEEPPARSLARKGDYWTIGFDGREALLKDSKGVRDLAALLVMPGREIHALDLMGRTVIQSDVGPTLDTTARQAYETRIRDLQEELEEAENNGDIGRADRAQHELDALIEQLVEATGLGGRDRRVGGDAERARSAVTQRLRGVLRKLDEVHPAAARHLAVGVTTGVFCSYAAPGGVEWDVDFGG